MSLFKTLIKETGNTYASCVDDGISAGDVSGFIDTGSYALNLLLSGSLFGGAPNGKVTAFAGEEATGKTFFVLGIVKKFLDTFTDGGVLYFESESAISKKMFVDRGIDPKRVHIIPVVTVQEFRNQAARVLDKYLETPEPRPPMIMVLDSLGMLSTTKEIEDIKEGKETRDMTRSQLLKAAFRVLTLKLGRASVPLLVTNHVYDVIGAYVPTKEMGGGGGLKFAASTIAFLSKKKVKDDKTKEVVGSAIRVKLDKSRFTREGKVITVALSYTKGLDPYHGLCDIAEEIGLFKKIAGKYELPDGSKVFEKHINQEPEKYFTPEVLQMIEEKAAPYYQYSVQQRIAADDDETITVPEE